MTKEPLSKLRRASGTPRPLTRRPSTSSLDDAMKRSRSNSCESDTKHSKQYMSTDETKPLPSQGIKFIRSSFRSKKAGQQEKLSPSGSPELYSGESPTKFVRPRPLISSKSGSLPPLPPLSRSYKNLRSSFRVKKTKSAFV